MDKKPKKLTPEQSGNTKHFELARREGDRLIKKAKGIK